MQSTTAIKEALEQKKMQQNEALIKESILNEMLHNVSENTLLSPELKSALILEIIKLNLDTYLNIQLSLDNKINPEVDKIHVNQSNQATTTTTGSEAPARPVKETHSNPVVTSDLVHIDTPQKPRSRSQNRKISLNLEERKARSKASKEGDVAKSKSSPKDKSSPRDIIIQAGTKSSDSLHDTAHSSTPSPRRNSSSPRWFLAGSESSESPRKRRSFTSPHSGKKESPREQAFTDLLPVNKETLHQYLNRLKPYLKMKDTDIVVLTDEDRPNIHLVVTPHRIMKTDTLTQTKTVILVDKQKIEGEGANRVIRGYDLINKQYLAIKILNKSVTKEVRDIEIENLKKRGWFYARYQINSNEQALIMKQIPGDTLLQVLYVTDETVSKHDIYANYCPHKKSIDFELQLKIIISLMKEVLKLQEQYGLLHRDLKPENIKVYYANETLKVRIIDFGDAVPVDSEIKELCGTDGYTDPEIYSLEHQEPYHKEHDYFSLGVIIAEILTSRNYQKAIREQKALVAHELFTTRISPSLIQQAMDDVFKPETVEDHYDSVSDQQKNLQHFMLVELKKLAKKMIMTRLRHSSLDEEIHRIETIEKHVHKFSKKVEHFWDAKDELQASLNKMNRNFSAGFFLPQKEFQINSAQDATECFKEMHQSIAEDDFTLYI
ncbi:putative protein kinase [Legionella moravica]|uniref:Ser/Thr protein kinase n=1 Tax=Legionella moravica TaxID=39962 RepID=A0A378JT04_9GAMM|nr:protein kinase family protein [Legionella moravica]KTD39055.1 putative protein kinase [Legionella moravica]STX61147.1 Ser/Thr protein kinase [Legionella moravica]